MTKLNDMTLTFGQDINLPIGKFPVAVQHILMQRTFAHIMGNEAAAVKTRLMGGDNPMTEDEANVAVDAWRHEKVIAMIEGKFSLRVVGPRLTADEVVMRDFARNAIITNATARKVALPKASDKDAWDAAIERFLTTPHLLALAQAEVTRRKASIAPAADLGDMFAAA